MSQQASRVEGSFRDDVTKIGNGGTGGVGGGRERRESGFKICGGRTWTFLNLGRDQCQRRSGTLQACKVSLGVQGCRLYGRLGWAERNHDHEGHTNATGQELPP